MAKMLKILPALAIGLMACNLALGPGSAQADDTNGDARKARILSNLKLQFPQLADLSPVMGEIKGSGIAGLDEGSFVVGGRQTQKFLVTGDNKKLWLIGADPIDVSKTDDQIAAENKERDAAAATEAIKRAADLDAAIQGQPFRGKADAKITVVEFSDFQCPYCARGAQTMEQLVAKYPNDVKFVFKHFPLNFHPWAQPAAVAANCAAAQKPEAFWKLHDAYFANQKDITPQNVMDKSREYLKDSGIDLAKFVACAEDKDTEEYKKTAAAVNADMTLGGRLGVSGTPGYFVNGHFLNGAMPIENFDAIITKIQAGK